MIQNIEEIRQIISSYFSEKGNAECVYLFGSLATGKIHSQSDADIGVLLDKSVTPNRYFDYRIATMNDLSDLLHGEVDVIVLNEAAPFLAFQIICDGKRLHDRRDESDRRFEVKTMMEYYDLKPYRHRCEEALIRRIRQA